MAAFTAACTDLDCTFTDGSSDPDGSVVSWLWDFGDGTTSTASSPTHTYVHGWELRPGRVSCNVHGEPHRHRGGVASASQTVSPTAPNQMPVAAFTATCTDLDCTFTDGSSDPDGSVVSWLWDFGDGTTSTASSPTHTYVSAATFTVSLTVTDDQGDGLHDPDGQSHPGQRSTHRRLHFGVHRPGLHVHGR
ncbi:MAG: PKD domain-containing protein [Gemmatimonadota bacterium]